MIEHLAVLIDTFPGAANQTRCFAHILNLVAKSVLRQFEAPKAKNKKAVDEAVKELATIFDELDDEAAEIESEKVDGDGSDDVEDDVVDDNDDGLPDEQDELSEDELLSLAKSVEPIRLMLTKVNPININDWNNTDSDYIASRCIPCY
jgi:hypothetical protein